jgi:hypothetical protein
MAKPTRPTPKPAKATAKRPLAFNLQSFLQHGRCRQRDLIDYNGGITVNSSLLTIVLHD